MTPVPPPAACRRGLFVLLGAALFSVTQPVGPLHAQTYTPLPRRLDPAGGATYWHGSAYQLPNHPGVTEAEILDHALTMPAVQELLSEAERRGYLRHAENDRGFVRSDPRMVGALLCFEKPGLDLSGEFGAPVLSVTTTDVYGTPRTAISLTVLLVDEATGAVRTADEETSLPGDGTIEYLDAAFSGGGPGRHQVHPESWSPTPQQKMCAKQLVICAAAANIGCVLQSFDPAAPAQVRVLRITLCAITVTVACLGDFVNCLDVPE
jgi:hypothetical protein